MKPFALLIPLGILLCTLGCSDRPPIHESFNTAGGETVELDQYLKSHQGLVVFYLSPECPLCQNYSVAIGKLEDEFRKKSIEFIGVVSGDFYPKEQVADYRETYNMDMDILMDPEFILSEYYSAQLTPEAHLLDRHGKLMYRGAIDNWAISLGKKRLRATAHYLQDALESFIAGERIDPKVTEPVGCYIE